MKKVFTLLLILVVINSFAQTSIANWNFFGQNTAVATSAATFYSSNLDASNILTRGGSAAASLAGNSFRTTGFQNNGISLTSAAYYQFTLSASSGYTLSLTSITGKGSGTATYSNSPGVTQQYAYSIDGAAFTLIGSPVITIGTGAIPSVDLSGISALQNLANTSTVTFRYFASGQTSTGGWGYNSPSAVVADNGLNIFGSLNSVLPVTLSSFTGTYKNKTSLLQWTAGVETSINSYTVERSTDGINFEGIGLVKATGSTEYSYTDATAKIGINFYRLKMQGINENKYSAVVKILSASAEVKINLYPSPAINTVNAAFTSEIKETTSLEITDTNGKTILQKNSLIQKGYNNINVDINTLTKGAYIFKIILAGKATSTIFTKL